MTSIPRHVPAGPKGSTRQATRQPLGDQGPDRLQTGQTDGRFRRSERQTGHQTNQTAPDQTNGPPFRGPAVWCDRLPDSPEKIDSTARDSLPPDVETAVAARVSARIAAARRRQEDRRALYAEKNRRRGRGLEARHAQKLERIAAQARDRQAGGSVRRAGRRGAA